MHSNVFTSERSSGGKWPKDRSRGKGSGQALAVSLAISRIQDAEPANLTTRWIPLRP
ncbi:hypothetical protein [Paraburkholderia sp. GAS32]|uniref:hypothetical protein n=1 Tax=Paraburkholderia sp. GAS32 TaxID=3035129 RepID=UPI003D199794